MRSDCSSKWEVDVFIDIERTKPGGALCLRNAVVGEVNLLAFHLHLEILRVLVAFRLMLGQICNGGGNVALDLGHVEFDAGLQALDAELGLLEPVIGGLPRPCFSTRRRARRSASSYRGASSCAGPEDGYEQAFELRR